MDANTLLVILLMSGNHLDRSSLRYISPGIGGILNSCCYKMRSDITQSDLGARYYPVRETLAQGLRDQTRLSRSYAFPLSLPQKRYLAVNLKCFQIFETLNKSNLLVFCNHFHTKSSKNEGCYFTDVVTALNLKNRHISAVLQTREMFVA